ncbi:MAG: site-specific integrase [Oricola sp.]
MATYRKRGDRWQVQVRRGGQPALSRSFTTKADAQRRARHVEAEQDATLQPVDFRKLERTTLRDILVRYRDEIIPAKRGHDIETIIVDAFLRNPIAHLTLDRLTPQAFATHRDVRLESVRPSTLLRELGIVQHALDVAMKEWGFPPFSNPVKGIRKPRLGSSRDRRVSPDEVSRLIHEAQRSRNEHLAPAIMLAVETGMRRGELLGMQWQHTDADARVVAIPHTKNGHPRRIPLSSTAANTLKSQMAKGIDRPLPMSSESLKKAWQRLVMRCDLEGIRFHDLRHEAISRFFERGLSMPEVALISGHRDPRMLFRYTHIRAETLLQKLG